VSEGTLTGLRQRFLDAATVDGKGGANTTGVRWWLKYCLLGRKVMPFSRLTASSPLEDKVEMESLLVDFCLWLALAKPSGKPISCKTILKYLSQVRAWHLRVYRTAICGDLDTKLFRDLMRGVARLVKQPQKRRRWGVRTQDLSKVIDEYLGGDSAAEANWAAALTVAFCGLLRAAELSLQSGEDFDPEYHLTRADVKFRTDASGREVAILIMRPAKGKPGREKEVPIFFTAGGTLLDPVRALKRLWALDPVPKELEAVTPLFRHGGDALRVADVRRMVKALMARLGLPAERYGAHSLRIGGATAGLAANVSELALRTAGRWSSDCYKLYARANSQAAARLSLVIGSTAFNDLERGEFIDEELQLTTATVAARGVYAGEPGIDEEMVADALAGDDASSESE
jgi:hypothetical protein